MKVNILKVGHAGYQLGSLPSGMFVIYDIVGEPVFHDRNFKLATDEFAKLNASVPKKEIVAADRKKKIKSIVQAGSASLYERLLAVSKTAKKLRSITDQDEKDLLIDFIVRAIKESTEILSTKEFINLATVQFEVNPMDTSEVGGLAWAFAKGTDAALADNLIAVISPEALRLKFDGSTEETSAKRARAVLLYHASQGHQGAQTYLQENFGVTVLNPMLQPCS